MRCYLKGTIGDQINLLLAASAWNLKKWMNSLSFFRFCLRLIEFHRRYERAQIQL